MKPHKCSKKIPLKNLYEVEHFLSKISQIKKIFCAAKAVKKLPKHH